MGNQINASSDGGALDLQVAVKYEDEEGMTG